MKYIAEIKFTGEKNCWECIIDRNNCRGKCWLKPIPDSITDTDSKQTKRTLEYGICTKPNGVVCDRKCGNNCEYYGQISPPEQTHADIMAELRRLREEIRMLREGERRG